MDASKLRESAAWTGTYKGVFFKIKNWGKENEHIIGDHPTGAWNYYLYIRPEKFTQGQWEKMWLDVTIEDGFGDRKMAAYKEHDGPLGSVYFAGGITFYEQHTDDCGDQHIKVGCDYMHSWDVHSFHTLNSIFDDVKQTVDEFLDNISNEGQ